MSMRISRRYHPTVSFVLFAGVTVLLGVGAINSQNNLLFFCFGSALAALLLSGFVSGSALMRVRLRRLNVGEAFVNAPLRIVYEVEHLGKGLPAFALHIEERKGPFGSVKDRATWPGFMRQPRAFLSYVARGKAAHAEAIVVPTRRGVATLTEMRLVTTFPFGAIKKSVSFLPGEDGLGRAEVVIRPEIVDIPASLSRKLAAATRDADRASKNVGRGDEFFGVREYAPGDSVRRIAWRATARLGELVVREDAAFDSSRILVVLRLSRRAVGPDRDALDERAISLAASVIVRSSKGGVAVGLSVPAMGVMVAPGAGDAHIATMLDALARIELSSEALMRTAAGDPSAGREAVVEVDADAPPESAAESVARAREAVVA
jgi:uncharacterized protein (DUF58 family)